MLGSGAKVFPRHTRFRRREKIFRIEWDELLGLDSVDVDLVVAVVLEGCEYAIHQVTEVMISRMLAQSQLRWELDGGWSWIMEGMDEAW